MSGFALLTSEYRSHTLSATHNFVRKAVPVVLWQFIARKLLRMGSDLLAFRLRNYLPATPFSSGWASSLPA
jgi:hypothetical protein